MKIDPKVCKYLKSFLWFLIRLGNNEDVEPGEQDVESGISRNIWPCRASWHSPEDGYFTNEFDRRGLPKQSQISTHQRISRGTMGALGRGRGYRSAHGIDLG